MRFILGLLAMVVGMVAASARASDDPWLEVRTDHFIIYIQDDQAAAWAFATKLERFDAALRRLYGVEDDPARRSNPLQIFAFSEDMYNATCNCSGYAVGYYSPRAGGSAIFSLYAPKVDAKTKPGDMNSQSVLLHEYSHHFMFSTYPIAYPLWYSEGFAEFNANVLFNENGSTTIGLPANYRAGAIGSEADYFSMTEMLDPPLSTRQSWQLSMIYARGWLLTHYLTLDGERKGQLAKYLEEMNRGKTSTEAARIAFGDLKKLYRDMFAYRHRNKLAAPFLVPPPKRPIAVAIRPLSQGEVAILLPRARVTSGWRAQNMGTVARAAEHAAERFPDDARVQAQLAHIEYLARRTDSAEKAADRALALDPDNMLALLYKGRAAVRRAAEAKATDPAIWSAARAPLIKANRADPNAALPLLYYYQSFLAAKQQPSANAVKGLSRAAVLAPEDSTVRVLLAERLLDQGDGLSARALLQPIAFAPHDDPKDNHMRAAIDLIDASKLKEARALLTKKDEDKDEGQGE
ncbi:hypothetical protein IAG41_08615 [Sphingomonas sp. JC676]|uniref:tetratricopeptide repeat protein n=1 Tax=Sphingomonas sp. JC676 TaxID=2768065 RepID=UPI00165844D6|nr:hypothetical protein [Sphingomonas sp. JC676]MBC9032451.1 hypothetical protein [Sphingomonas sp. JC676]